MNLRQLDHFLAIARHLSITAAAAELGVAQPTLTKSIRALEQELGASLFQRLPRGVTLTDFGHSLVRHARIVQVQLQDAANEIEGLRGGTAGTVTIGAGPAWLRRHLPEALARTLARNPALKVRIEGGFDDALLRALRRGEVDLVIAELPAPEQARDLALRSLTADILGVCCRAGHPLVAYRMIELAQLLPFAWVMPPRSTRAHYRLRALFVIAGLPPPEPIVETESMTFLLQMLRHTDALTFTVSTSLRSPEGEGLVMLEVPRLALTREAGVITRRNGWLSPAASTVIEELVAICEAEPQN